MATSTFVHCSSVKLARPSQFPPMVRPTDYSPSCVAVWNLGSLVRVCIPFVCSGNGKQVRTVATAVRDLEPERHHTCAHALLSYSSSARLTQCPFALSLSTVDASDPGTVHDGAELSEMNGTGEQHEEDILDSETLTSVTISKLTQACAAVIGVDALARSPPRHDTDTAGPNRVTGR